MLTVKKLLSLKERTRIRKISMILTETAHLVHLGKMPDMIYINEILPLANLKPIDFCCSLENINLKNFNSENIDLKNSDTENGSENTGFKNVDLNFDSENADFKNIDLKNAKTCKSSNFPAQNDALKHLAFKLEDYAQKLLSQLGAEPSDWDFVDDDGALDVSKRVIQDKVLVLDRIRSPFNVGAIFRSADSFGIKQIILVEGSASPEHQRARRTARGCTQTVDWLFMSEERVLAFLDDFAQKNGKNGNILALELGGQNIDEFEFKRCGIAVLGSEEFGISPEILKRCTDRVSIQMGGTKGSLNVSVATGILLHRWFKP